jgi:hypothetical protein
MIHDNTNINDLQINNYNLITQCSTKKCSTKGGLAIYVQSDIQMKKTQHFNTFTTWEGLTIDIIDKNNTNIKICNAYRPPRNNNNHASIENFLGEFAPAIRTLTHKTKNVILTGDFNIDLLKLTTNTKFQEFYDLLVGLNLIPIITYPTRTTKTKATLIDHIFCKSPNPLNISETGILVKKISDHMATFSSFNYKINPNYREIKVLKTRSFTGTNMCSFYNDMSQTDWATIFNHNITADPKESYDTHFSIKLDELINKHFPEKEKRFKKYKHKKSKWMMHETLTLIKKKDELYLKTLNTDPHTPEYLTLRDALITASKEVRKSIRENKSTFYKSELDKNKHDIRKTWDTITDIINKSKVHKGFPKIFKIDGRTITDKSDIATNFNNFFINIGPNLAKSIDLGGKPAFESYLKFHNTTTPFTFKTVEEKTTRKIINSFKPKKSMGFDNISGILLKFCADIIITPLTAIINQSLQNGIFPDKLKIARVIPIFKKDDEHDINNYRPISLLPNISKIFEKIVHIQLSEYLTINNLLDHNQYGLRGETLN